MTAVQPGLDTAERQVATKIEDIRKDHVERYKFVIEQIKQNSKTARYNVIDIGCGVGYGSQLLAKAKYRVTAVDRDEHAIAYAQLHWAHKNIRYHCLDFTNTCPGQVGDYHHYAVAFEIIEHLADPRPLLSGISAYRLFVSVPNESVFPYRDDILHHHRHYTQDQLERLLNECNWIVESWYGQKDTESEVNANVNGRTLIAVCRQGDRFKHPTGRRPESVMLCGLGPSKYELMEMMIQHDYRLPTQELWTINKGLALMPHADVTFIMDDIYEYAERHPAYGDEIKNYNGTIISQTSLPNNGELAFIEYPLVQVLDHWGGNARNWLHTISVGYILAYAGMIGVKQLLLAGIDCSWPNRPDLSEAGNAVVCYWIGRLESSGCEVIINSESALNSTNEQSRYEYRRYYGYLKQPLI